MRRNVAGQVIGAQMVSASDGSPFTGAVTVYVTRDGGTQAIGSGVCTHEGFGFHTYPPSQTETDGAHVAFTFVGTGAVPATIQVYPSFPQTGDAFARIGAPVGASISADIAGVQADTDNIQTRLPAALVSGRMDASVSAMTSPVLNAVANQVWAYDMTTHTGLNNAGDRLLSALDVSTWDLNKPLTAIQTRAALGLATANLDTQLSAASIAGAVWNAATVTYGSAGSYGALVETNLDVAVSSRSTLTAAQVNAEADAALADVGLTTTVTGRVDAAVSSRLATAGYTAPPTAIQNADALLARDMGAVTGEAARSPLNALRFLRNRWSMSGTTLTVMEEDDATAAWTAVVTPAPGADPISGTDPF